MAYMPPAAVPLATELKVARMPGDGKTWNRVARLLHSNGITSLDQLDTIENLWTNQRLWPSEAVWLAQLGSQAKPRTRSRSRSPPVAVASLTQEPECSPSAVVASDAPSTAVVLREAQAPEDSARNSDDPVASALVRSGVREQVATEASSACRANGLVKLMQFRLAEQENLAGIQCSCEARPAIAKLPGLAAKLRDSVDGAEQLNDLQGKAVASVVNRIDEWQPDGSASSSCRMARGPMQNL